MYIRQSTISQQFSSNLKYTTSISVITITYNICLADFLIIISLCFIILPFTYFYADDVLSSDERSSYFFTQEDESSGDDECNTLVKKERKQSQRRVKIIERVTKALKSSVSEY